MNFKSLNTQNYILEKFKLSDVDKNISIGSKTKEILNT